MDGTPTASLGRLHGSRVFPTMARREPPSPEQLLAGLAPMFATLVEALPGPSGGYCFELKFDGYRTLVAVAAGRTRVHSRRGQDFSQRFSRVAAAAANLPVRSAVVDGEVVALDERGVPDFNRLQRGAPERLTAFDLLFLDGEDLRERPLEERRERLRAILSGASGAIGFSEDLPGPLERALGEARRRGHEGVMAKRRGSRYAAGRRSTDWLKVKLTRRQEAAVVGFTESEGLPGHVASLALAVREGDRYEYVGAAKTGLREPERTALYRALTRDLAERPTAEKAPRDPARRWVRPRLVAEVRFMDWTPAGRMRHVSFIGLRDDKDPAECRRERPATAGHLTEQPAAPPPPAPPALPVPLPHPDKVFYPRDGITRGDLAAYYRAVAGPLLRALADRPLDLERFPEGIDGKGFFQFEPAQPSPWMRLVPIRTRTHPRIIRHLVADRPEVLDWFARYAVITPHMWSARVGSLEHPDWISFDLDPAERFAEVIEPARALREFFGGLGMQTVIKTSGRRGLHLLVPLAPVHSHEEVAAFAARVAGIVAALLPRTVTIERTPSRRRGRLYLDAGQNALGKTLAAPYAPRADDGAPVSTPIAWDELGPGLDPAAFRIATVPARVAAVGDLFAPALAGTARLPPYR